MMDSAVEHELAIMKTQAEVLRRRIEQREGIFRDADNRPLYFPRSFWGPAFQFDALDEVRAWRIRADRITRAVAVVTVVALGPGLVWLQFPLMATLGLAVAAQIVVSAVLFGAVKRRFVAAPGRLSFSQWADQQGAVRDPAYGKSIYRSFAVCVAGTGAALLIFPEFRPVLKWTMLPLAMSCGLPVWLYLERWRVGNLVGHHVVAPWLRPVGAAVLTAVLWAGAIAMTVAWLLQLRLATGTG
jgi:hypothetical protein